MQINSNSGSVSGYFNASPIAPPPRAAADSAIAQPSRGELLTARRQLYRVLESLVAIDRLVNGRSTVLSGLPSARSEPPLSLDLSTTASALESAQEVNATPTSFSPFVPVWDDGSAAFLTIGGAYTNTNLSGQFQFQSRDNGVHGQDRLRIRVTRPNGSTRNITIQSNHDPDRRYNIGNGLFITLSAGSLNKNDTTSIDVFANVGSAVDPDLAFNGSGNDNPNFEYGLPAIVDGEFDLNGVSIAVAAGDSLSTVIDRINQSNAGVSAAFNAATERVELTNTTLGSAGAIDIANDTSNFVQATKLDTAVLTPGIDPETGRPLQSVGQFSGVQSGSFTVNGTTIDLDSQTDSLDDVITRINESGADVTASFDTASQRVVITGDTNAEPLTIDGNGTGIFGALNLPEGRVDPRANGSGFERRYAARIALEMGEAMSALNEFMQGGNGGAETAQIQGLRNLMSAAFSKVLGASTGSSDAGVGLRVNFDNVGKDLSQFTSFDAGELAGLARKRGKQVKSFFNGSGETAGFLQSVGSAAERALVALSASAGESTSLVDVYA